MKKMSTPLFPILLLVACGGGDELALTPIRAAIIAPLPTETVIAEEPTPAPTTTFQLEAWADNWFAAYLGEALIVEDSVSITTERSF